MSDSPRRKPYVWVSWITKLLAGEDVCEWKSWYKAHYRYAKREEGDTSELDAWVKQHDAMTEEHASQLRANDWKVYTEDANAFKLDGKQATLAGKPDIIATRTSEKKALVVDEKSGKKRESDHWQVRVYLFALPLAWPRVKKWKLEGLVDYRNGPTPVKFEQEHIDRISDVMRLVGGDDEPARTPSVRECRFCNIANCPERIEAEAATADASGYF